MKKHGRLYKIFSLFSFLDDVAVLVSCLLVSCYLFTVNENNEFTKFLGQETITIVKTNQR